MNKAIVDNETGFAGNSDETYRMQGWLFILAGGSLYNNLDYSFTPEKENGTYQYPATQPGGGSTTLRKQMGFLQHFIGGVDFIKMHPDLSFIREKFSKDMKVQALVDTGKQYAAYFYGEQKGDLSVELPSGRYKVQWMDPLTGSWENMQRISHNGGLLKVLVPAYKTDIALRIDGSR